jgi:hypothetical protein
MGTDMGTDQQPETLSGLLAELKEVGQDDMVSVGDAADRLQNRSIGPLLLIPSLLALIPLIGAIPGMSVLTGTIILLISIQFFFPRRGIYLPGWLRRRRIARQTLADGIDKSLPAIRWLERAFRPRLTVLAKRPFVYAVPAACIVMAILMYPAALLPWAVMAPAGAIFVYAVGITLRDGLMLALGHAISILSAWLLYTLVW